MFYRCLAIVIFICCGHCGKPLPKVRLAPVIYNTCMYVCMYV